MQRYMQEKDGRGKVQVWEGGSTKDKEFRVQTDQAHEKSQLKMMNIFPGSES